MEPIRFDMHVLFNGLPDIEKVVFAEDHTIVVWTDGVVTSVTRCDADEYDEEKALAMAVAKRALGSYTAFQDALDSAFTVGK